MKLLTFSGGPRPLRMPLRWLAWCCTPWVLAGCASGTLGASMLGSVMTAATLDARQPERMAQERAQQQALAERHAVPEQAPAVETQSTYLTVVRQIQSRSLWHASLAHLDALEQQWGVSEESTLLRADALRHVGDSTTSAALYERLTGTPHAAAALHGLGLIAARNQQLAQAIEHMEQARKHDPLRVALLNDLGYAYLQQGQLDRAGLLLRQAAELGPDQLRVFANLALLLLTQGQEQEATQLMAQLRMQPQTREAVTRQALSLRTRVPPSPLQPAATVGPMTEAPTPDAPATPQASETVTPPPAATPVAPAVTREEDRIQLAGGGLLSLRLSQLPRSSPILEQEPAATWVASRP